MQFGLIATLALGGVALLLGEWLRRRVRVLADWHVPPPVIGGLLVAVAVLACREYGGSSVAFDTTLQTPLMVAFFTTIGFAASVRLLRVGGGLLLKFYALVTAFIVVQALVGGAVATALGQPALLGLLAGPVTLAGGPATGLAFAPAFESAGVAGAPTIALAVAVTGIVLGGIVGGPVVAWLMRRPGYRATGAAATVPDGASAADVTDAATAASAADATSAASAGPVARAAAPAAPRSARNAALGDDPALGLDAEGAGETPATVRLVRNLVVVLVAMAIGAAVDAALTARGVRLPAYVGAMLAAAAFRYVDDRTGRLGLDARFLAEFGAVTLSLFLVVAIMTLDLRQLAGLALPLATIVLVQAALVALVAAPLVFRAMGRDYEAAVMSGGFVGFMLGTTANAMAVMRAVVDRHGAAPAAFLVAPLVGAFLLDFSNAVVITAFLNLFE